MASEAIGAVKYAPRRIQTALLLTAFTVIGALGTELYHIRGDRLSKIEARLDKVEEDVKNVAGNVGGLDVKVASIAGSQTRLETKFDRIEDKVDRVLELLRRR